jgi:hypothetical protein
MCGCVGSPVPGRCRYGVGRIGDQGTSGGRDEVGDVHPARRARSGAFGALVDEGLLPLVRNGDGRRQAYCGGAAFGARDDGQTAGLAEASVRRGRAFMASLWDRVLSRLQGNDMFSTVQDRKEFTVRIQSEQTLVVTTSKGADQRIYRKDFQKAEEARLVKVGVKPSELSNAGVGKGFSYIARIIHDIARRG